MANSRFAITVAALLNTGSLPTTATPAPIFGFCPVPAAMAPDGARPGDTATDRTGADGYNTTGTPAITPTTSTGPHPRAFVSGVVA